MLEGQVHTLGVDGHACSQHKTKAEIPKADMQQNRVTSCTPAAACVWTAGKGITAVRLHGILCVEAPMVAGPPQLSSLTLLKGVKSFC
jgi:hypothetical protein